MTPTWTGAPGEPVPPRLRHDIVVSGEGWDRHWTCTVCGQVDEPQGGPCPVAVARRIAELEAHEASLHKHGAAVAAKIAAWLREQAEQEAALARTAQYVDDRMRALALAAEGALDAAAYAIERGEVVPVGDIITEETP